MKKLVYSLLIIPAFISCGGSESETENTTTEQDTTVQNTENVEEVEIVNSITISENVVGIFEMGKPVPTKLPEELKMRQFIEEETVEGNTIEHTHNVIFNQLEDVAELIMNQGSDENHFDKTIKEILVISNYYETQEGIKVGSSVEKFKEAFADAKIWYDKTRDQYFMDSETLVGVQFILDPMDIKKKAKGSADMQELSFSVVPAEAEVKKIRMY
ncbi:hypothetical protein K6119_12315 [Paracrocinitomix mangrovi]|uniref:hypothetical protein n=1 Tax=Paracrocinitomix mangrovi TaxID=2862509 RepID=UPI001C8DB10E|nr:hypothetical protein [Paracrocinitomix mangrovi]UKN00516.1 hypothetical protein K6119_12315 [Paracrocinitomix mangrovi]